MKKDHFSDKGKSHDDLKGTHDEKDNIKERCQTCESLMEQLLRARAEFDNARKRWDRDRVDIIKYANSGLLQELVGFMDVIEQALKTVNEHCKDEQVVKGVELMQSNFISLLSKKGVEVIDVKGKAFDPHTCEMVAPCDVEDEGQDGMVLDIVQKGYKLDGKVLRTTKVIVGMLTKKTEVEEQGIENKSDEVEDGEKGTDTTL
ncbi:MAG: nucleotide exchange factor GrpE [Candidatus Omnitrophica bacterium]|nr:nucleotide exchange factor GrpE [Candidatus Omnitrophota bacterium]MDD5081350.1 nucleotide exchange factor GrpE [Candidatus Omnitrophota bacterium]MDD5441431.1 nucleotide exchange factor GrpE [Candidatus Omnitrophota bacterium]